MIELKRQQMRLKQKDLAQLLEVPAGRLSQILSGKRRVTLDLALRAARHPVRFYSEKRLVFS